MPRQRVFVSYAHADKIRVRPLVEHLVSSGFTVWWDDALETGTPWRDVILERLRGAACVVVVWSTTSVTRAEVLEEAGRALRTRVLLPLRIDATVQPPHGFAWLQYADLSDWNGAAPTPSLLRFVDSVRAALASEPELFDHWGSLMEPDAVEQAMQATELLENLGIELSKITVFLDATAPVDDLRGALEEVAKTYRTVEAAIRRFVAPVIGVGPIDGMPYLDMEGGSMVTEIERGRGHCSLISDYYGRVGGLREWVAERRPDILGTLDSIFAKLGQADGDMFVQLAEIGRTLTNESRALVNALVQGNEAAARTRIVEGREKLQPLRERMTQAMRRLQQLLASLGYTEPT
jgi:hypothetical protein